MISKERGFRKQAGGHFSAPAKSYWENSKILNLGKGRTDKPETSWSESEDSDNFSLGINGGEYPSSQEKDAASKNTQVGLVQCSVAYPKGIASWSSREKEKKLKSVMFDGLLEEDYVWKLNKSGTVTLNEMMSDDTNSKAKDLEVQEIETVGHSSPRLTNSATETTMLGESPKPENNRLMNMKPPNVEERRISARLQKDILLTTEDRNLKMCKKRNLEGTNLNTENSFSVLADVDIANMSYNMGIMIDESNFTAIDLIKDLEVARHSIADKKIAPKQNIVEETIIEEIEEELTDFDMEVIQTPKRKGKPKNRLSMSGPKLRKKARKILVQRKPEGITKESWNPSWPKRRKKQKKKN